MTAVGGGARSRGPTQSGTPAPKPADSSAGTRTHKQTHVAPTTEVGKYIKCIFMWVSLYKITALTNRQTQILRREFRISLHKLVPLSSVKYD